MPVELPDPDGVEQFLEDVAKAPIVDVHGEHFQFSSKDRGLIYEFAAVRADSVPKLLGWVDHLSRKSWMTAELMGQFVVLAAERLGFGVDHHS